MGALYWAYCPGCSSWERTRERAARTLILAYTDARARLQTPVLAYTAPILAYTNARPSSLRSFPIAHLLIRSLTTSPPPRFNAAASYGVGYVDSGHEGGEKDGVVGSAQDRWGNVWCA